MAKRYKVFFHRGEELVLDTRVQKGYASVDEAGLHVDGPEGFVVPKEDLLSAEVFRLHGLGRVVRVETRTGRVFLAVVRLMIGQFAFINFLATGKLQKELSAAAQHPSLPVVKTSLSTR